MKRKTNRVGILIQREALPYLLASHHVGNQWSLETNLEMTTPPPTTYKRKDFQVISTMDPHCPIPLYPHPPPPATQGQLSSSNVSDFLSICIHDSTPDPPTNTQSVINCSCYCTSAVHHHSEHPSSPSQFPPGPQLSRCSCQLSNKSVLGHKTLSTWLKLWYTLM